MAVTMTQKGGKMGYAFWYFSTGSIRKGFPSLEAVRRCFAKHTKFKEDRHDMTVVVGELRDGFCTLKISAWTSDPRSRAAFLADIQTQLIDI